MPVVRGCSGPVGVWPVAYVAPGGGGGAGASSSFAVPVVLGDAHVFGLVLAAAPA